MNHVRAIPIKLQSTVDASINHVIQTQDGGFWESRWVQRDPSYGIIYVSSQSGCDQSCRFCHLTATRQTQTTQATVEDFVLQARRVLESVQALVEQDAGWVKPEKIHINFMARGEPLLNPEVVHPQTMLWDALEQVVHEVLPGVLVYFKVSTIMPQTWWAWMKEKPHQVTLPLDPRVQLYYSLYSLNPQFRKRFVPKAMDPHLALDLLVQHQGRTGQEMVIHHALIQGQNDDLHTIDAWLSAVQERGLRVKFNLVRYNPPHASAGVETEEDQLQLNFQHIQHVLGHPDSRIVPRVGWDVKASCGMFITPQIVSGQEDQERREDQELKESNS